MPDLMTSDRKLRYHIAAVVMVHDHQYGVDQACDLADKIINELGMHRETSPDFIYSTDESRTIRKRCYRFSTDWYIE